MPLEEQSFEKILPTLFQRPESLVPAIADFHRLMAGGEGGGGVGRCTSSCWQVEKEEQWQEFLITTNHKHGMVAPSLVKISAVEFEEL